RPAPHGPNDSRRKLRKLAAAAGAYRVSSGSVQPPTERLQKETVMTQSNPLMNRGMFRNSVATASRLMAATMIASMWLVTPAAADPFFFSTGVADGLIGARSAPADDIS